MSDYEFGDTRVEHYAERGADVFNTVDNITYSFGRIIDPPPKAQ